MRFCIDPSWGEAMQKHSRLELSLALEEEVIPPDITIFAGTSGDEDRQEIRKEDQYVSKLIFNRR